MKFRERQKDRAIGLDMTPLIDMVFLLIIFFMVSTTFIFTGAVGIDLPKAQGENVEIKENVRISVTNLGDVYIDGDRYDEAQIPSILKLKGERLPGAILIIEADSAALHGKVVSIIDEGKKAGFAKFAIATQEEK